MRALLGAHCFEHGRSDDRVRELDRVLVREEICAHEVAGCAQREAWPEVGERRGERQLSSISERGGGPQQRGRVGR